jgi:hypothetical protein
MDLQKYIIEIEKFGKFEIESTNVMYALELIREMTKLNIKEFAKLIIISAFVIIRDDFSMDITHILNGI